MKATSRQALASFVRARRTELDMSARGLARVAGIDSATVVTIEQGKLTHPRVDTIRALANALEVRLADMYALIDWLPEGELPSLRPYMRAKFDGLSNKDIARVENYVNRLQGHGPLPGEDE